MTKTRAIRPAFVVTVGALSAVGLSACKTNPGTTSTPPVDHPKVETSNDPAAFHVREMSRPIDWDAYNQPLNGRTEAGKMLYRGQATCYFVGEFDAPPTSWVPPPTEAYPCPESMRSAHWSHCLGGRLSANADASACLCAMDGNPPPPPHLQDCPAPPLAPPPAK